MNEIVEWAWENLKNPTTQLAIVAAKKGVTKGAELIVKRVSDSWAQLQWHEAESRYKSNLLKIVRCTKVLGNPKEIEIDKIYTDVYVFDKLSAIRRYAESLDEDEFDVRGNLDARERIKAEDVALGNKNTFILGRPGAGKTTFLKHLAIVACRKGSEATPIFISLKDWSDSSSNLLKYISKQFEICGFPDSEKFVESLLDAGKALILFDGLDEVNQWQDKRNRIIKDIVDFSNKYYKNKYCLTCRTAATDYSFERFSYVEVADFTSEQQELFANLWYGNESKQLALFLDAWRNPRSAGFRDLGRTPLLLTLLCLAFDETLTFPTRQVDVYQEAINALLKKWDTSRLIVRDAFYENLSFGQRQQLLETVAAKFYFDSRTVFRKAEISTVIEKFINSLPDADINSEVDGSELVKQIEAQHGLVIERAKDLYTFSHLTIQEYFTACFVAKNQNANLRRQIVKSALNDQKWREVMIYTVALLPEADSLLDEILQQVLNMKVASSGVLIFLGWCYCEAKLMEINTSPPIGSIYQYFAGLRDQIEKYVQKLRQPSLTSAELSKFAEHINVLNSFLKSRAAKIKYQQSARISSAAAAFLKEDPLDLARLLGGYFIKPEQFINFFYASRLLMECLDVAITTKRGYYFDAILGLNDKEMRLIEQQINS
ncbi:NACHT domain-containing protein [Paracidovorax konjaci]|uniref:NACHT domain-containing protein n=1 Tax=Paracidovorax konjaci TaxID=32040 RepID=A0A1I1WFI3_9BURK|nr:NACHT domain-containing protein [Paracidovorax konjaci]SFD93944.1 NACHT domain-containing protein [Paracidovorax konjaci]